MYNFTINMAELTDEDIYARMEKANGAISKAYMSGASSSVITQMQLIIQSYQFELSDRAQRHAFDLNRKYLEAVIETDPELAEPVEAPKEEQKPRRRVQF